MKISKEKRKTGLFNRLKSLAKRLIELDDALQEKIALQVKLREEATALGNHIVYLKIDKKRIKAEIEVILAE